MSEGPAGGQDSRPGPEPSAPAAGNDPEGADTGGAHPAGHDTYDLYQRGLELLGRGSAAAAAQLLERAAGNFRRIVDASPSDDYAQFGLGLALARTGDPGAAAEHLALAAAMQPNLRHYTDALRSVRATLRARAQAEADNPENSERDARDA
jgi:tetratricopeptide (TPR) repeat protein